MESPNLQYPPGWQSENNGTNKFLIGSIAVLVFILGYAAYAKFGSIWPFTKSESVACTLDAKLCPDGSYVGRSGSNCEFSACPNESEMSGWKTYVNTKYGYEIRFPESWINDSTTDDDDAHIHSKPPGEISSSISTPTTIEIQTNRTKPANVSLFDHVKKLAGEFQPNNVELTTFNGYPAVKVVPHGGEGPDGPGYFIERNSTSYVYLLIYIGYEKSEIDRVLSTFRFTK